MHLLVTKARYALALALTLLATGAAGAEPVRAEDAPPSQPARSIRRGRAPSPDADLGPHRFILRGEVGMGGPAGFMGLTAGVRPAGPLVIEYSTGGGLSGWQNALLLRLRSASHERSMSLALGPSVGWRFDEQRAYFWGHVELAYVIDGHRPNAASHLLFGGGITFFIAESPEVPEVSEDSGAYDSRMALPPWPPPLGPFFRIGGGWGI